jgi:hypothetical protein
LVLLRVCLLFATCIAFPPNFTSLFIKIIIVIVITIIITIAGSCIHSIAGCTHFTFVILLSPGHHLYIPGSSFRSNFSVINTASLVLALVCTFDWCRVRFGSHSSDSGSIAVIGINITVN